MPNTNKMDALANIHNLIHYIDESLRSSRSYGKLYLSLWRYFRQGTRRGGKERERGRGGVGKGKREEGQGGELRRDGGSGNRRDWEREVWKLGEWKRKEWRW